LVGGPEIWGFVFWENGVLRGPVRVMRERPRMWNWVSMMLSRDDGSVEFDIFGGPGVFEQSSSLVVFWI
jgi:hypothetical protein